MSKARRFSVVLIAEDNGTYQVIVPALPEVNAMGVTRDEAYANAAEAIELVLEQRLADGVDVPEGDTVEIGQVRVAAAR
ncbi:MAG: type II toxin-antitoxin system HicB family antitoxin [Rhodospirillales bacterium]|nr:type II toxin-antitoxin system HicB family antitoxin [Rhodospirillales bacterium]